MPLSSEALAGLRAAVEWNPHAAWLLLGILHETPELVRYKAEDRHGPLGFIFASPPRRVLAPGASLPAPPRPLAAGVLEACATFNDEWLRRAYTKRELAEAIAHILAEVAPRHAAGHPSSRYAILYERGKE